MAEDDLDLELLVLEDEGERQFWRECFLALYGGNLDLDDAARLADEAVEVYRERLP